MKTLYKSKKKLLSWLLAIAIVFTMMPASFLTVCAEGIDTVVTALTENTTEFLGGDGTEENPYLISNKTHLNNVRNYLDAHFKMVANIEFTEVDFAENGQFYNDGQGWEPIGMNSERPFFGSLDGDGHTITGLVCHRSGADEVCAGLFGYNQGHIQNLGMVEGDVSATSTANSSYARASAGGIAGSNVGTISDCYNTGSVSAAAIVSYAGASAGGIVGSNYNRGTISNCYNTGSASVTATANSSYAYVGGIAGSNVGTISDCYNTGSVSAAATASYADASAGGIAGSNYNRGTISNCYNTGSVSATSTATANSSYKPPLYRSFHNRGYKRVVMLDRFRG